MRQVNLKLLAMALLAMVFRTDRSFGQYFEVGDAGDSLATAQSVPTIPSIITDPGFGGFVTIHGSTMGESSSVDMYQFTINTAGPAQLTASLDPFFAGFADFDTQLWLFDADGFGVLANDDFISFQSMISTEMAEGGPVTLNPGIYYLAVSGFNNDPMSAGGAIFTQQTFTQVSIADGPGGGLPLSGWTGGGSSGSYQLHLSFFLVPAPTTIVLLGAFALPRRRRR